MVFARFAPTAHSKAVSLLRTVQYTHPPTCPCYGVSTHPHRFAASAASLLDGAQSLATPIGPQKEYAFELSASSIRFGPEARGKWEWSLQT